ncbi:SRPBCC family protein [Kitasatospora sp. NPDC085895]|uniref:SRPBCC family protein n=1 Tax=Kitasatospora sp. NPDC085895 TaxID=3155057 RepID=UPI003450C30D
MAGTSTDRDGGGIGALLDELPTDRLKDQARELATALGERAMVKAGDKIGDVTDRLLDYVEHGPAEKIGEKLGGGGGGVSPMKMMFAAGASGVKQLVSNKLTGGGKGKGKGGGKKLKLTNIVEDVEVGVPVRVAYNQWTQFQDFPKFTKRLESANQESEQKVSWKAGIFLSHRTWESTIVEQVPDETIVWRSKGNKGHVDGTVTFHELAPNLTKILMVLEYHPQGLFERTGNIWRAQGRRARLELKHFRRHVMTHTILDPDSVEGWRGEIRDSKVVKSHEDALKEEEEAEGREGEEAPEDDRGAEQDEYEDEEPLEGEESDEPEEPEDEYDDEEEDEGDEPEESYDEEDEDEDEEPYEDEPEDESDAEQDRGEDSYEDEPEDEPEDEDEDEPEDEEYDEDSYDEEEPEEEEPEENEEPAPRSRRRVPAGSR